MRIISRILLLSALFTAACAHHRDVRPGAEGIHRVVVRAEDQESAEHSAISQAENYCQEGSLHAAFVEEQKTQYTGTMDEHTRDTLRKASRAATIVGGGASVLGRDQGVRDAGGAVGAAGVVGSVMTGGHDYTADMKFRCK